MMYRLLAKVKIHRKKLKEKHFLLGLVEKLQGSEIVFDKGGRRRCAPFKVRDWAARSRESDRYLMQRPLH